MRKVELLPTRDCEAGYGPGSYKYNDLISLDETYKNAKKPKSAYPV